MMRAILFLWTVLILIVMGCNALDNNIEESKDHSRQILGFEDLPWANNVNQSKYLFQAQCSKEGETLRYKLSESKFVSPVPKEKTGEINCTEGKWKQSIDLSIFADGGIDLVIFVGSYSAKGTVKKDTTPPTMGHASFKVSGTSPLHSDDQLTFTVEFDDDVMVAGIPRLDLTFTKGSDSTTKYARYDSSASSTRSMVLIYTIQGGDMADAVTWGHSGEIDLDGGSIEDGAGNPATLSPLTVDFNGVSVNSSPIVLTSVSAPANSFVKNGDPVVTLTATFSNAVTITGPLVLQLDVDGNTVQATYSGDGTSNTTHTFSYPPGAGDDGDIQVTAFSGGTIQGATPVFSPQNPLTVGNLVLDNIPPTVTGLADDNQVTTSKTWNWGCDDASGCQYRYKVDQSANTEPAGNYGDEVSATQNTGDGTYYIHVQARDKAGNESLVAHVGVVLDNTAATITTLTPPASNTYGIGENVEFVVEFSEDITIAGGVPRLEIILASGNRYADYTADANPRTMAFSYQVQEGDLDGDGVELGNGGHIDLQGATIKGGVDMDAQLTALNFSGLDQVKIDGVKPSFTIAAAPGDYKSGESILLTVTFSKSVVVSGGVPRIILEVGNGQDVNTVYGDFLYGGSGDTYTANYLVREGQNDNDGIRVLGILLPAGVRIEDANGNQAVLNNTQSLAEVILDNIPPTVTGLADDNQVTTSKTWNWGCDDASGCQYRYKVDQSANTEPAGNYGDEVSATQNTGDGTYYIHVQAQDKAGNESLVAHVGVVLDNTAATITTLTPPASNTYGIGENVEFVVEFSEDITIAGGVPDWKSSWPAGTGMRTIPQMPIPGRWPLATRFRKVIWMGMAWNWETAAILTSRGQPLKGVSIWMPNLQH